MLDAILAQPHAHFLIYLVPSIALVMIFMRIYTAFTPQNEISLIRHNVPAAAISYVGAMIGFTLPVASAVMHSVSLVDWLIWGITAGIIQIVAFFAFTKFYHETSSGIENNNIALAVKLAGVKIMIGILNAAAMTY